MEQNPQKEYNTDIFNLIINPLIFPKGTFRIVERTALHLCIKGSFKGFYHPQGQLGSRGVWKYPWEGGVQDARPSTFTIDAMPAPKIFAASL